MLLSSGQEKNSRLQQAYQALQFQRSLDDIDEWAGSVERELTNEDCGSDLPSVNRLLKALQGLEEEVDQYRDRIQTIMDTAKSLVSQGNHLEQEIQTRTSQTISRYNGLAEPLLGRRETLEAWQLLFQFYRDEEEELMWMTDRLPANSSAECGNTLGSTQTLIKKHQVLMQEVSSRSPLVQAVQEAGQRLVRGRHFASHDILERVGELQRASEDLRREGLKRSRLLQEALRIHHFLSEVSEMEYWVEEQGGLLDSEEVGRTEEVTEVLLRRLASLDLEAQRGRLEELQKTGDALLLLGHPSSPQVSEGLARVQERYEVLVGRAAGRRAALQQQLRVHVSLLGHNRLTSVLQLAPPTGAGKEAELAALWDHLNQALRTRRQALQEAREVQQLSVDVEDLRSRLGEKEARDLVLLGEEVSSSREQGQALVQRLPRRGEEVLGRQVEVEALWRRLLELASRRRRRLTEADCAHRYLSQWKHLM
ncbi:hypothetical protein CRUP_037945 [Coryphaenoides rupestris]|nr:hypothetical protein CRUP_037945 [Coryphaenoides rupestris]